jgi:hypothetical protein
VLVEAPEMFASAPAPPTAYRQEGCQPPGVLFEQFSAEQLAATAGKRARERATLHCQLTLPEQARRVGGRSIRRMQPSYIEVTERPAEPRRIGMQVFEDRRTDPGGDDTHLTRSSVACDSGVFAAAPTSEDSRRFQLECVARRSRVRLR